MPTVRYPSVRLTVRLSHSTAAAACGGFAAVIPAGRIYRSIAARPAPQHLSRAFSAPGQHTAKDEESARDNHLLACNFAKYSPILFFY